MAILGIGAVKSTPTAGEDFHPIKEAELPQGFPGYTAVGKIEIKHYPAYRKASASGAAEFWTLFYHIKKNNIAMTAPVELEYGDPRQAKPQERSMSFLYERPDQGAAGKHGFVEVTDVPAMTVVSIGCRGMRTPATIDEACGRLLKWLDEKKDTYITAGPLRIMGYNSPFVSRDKQFFEVQVPVCEKEKGRSAAD